MDRGMQALLTLRKGCGYKFNSGLCDETWPYSLGYGAGRGFIHLGIAKADAFVGTIE